MARRGQRRDNGFLIVLFIVCLIIFTFVMTILWSWEAPVPTRQVIKVLPDAALTGGAVPVDGSGLSEPEPRYVGPINVPTRQVEIPETAETRRRGLIAEDGGAIGLDDGPITIDLRSGN